MLGSRLDLTAADAWVVEAFASQRLRLLDVLADLDDADWDAPTRCSEWNVRQLVLHVVGATDACRSTLAGTRAVFGAAFDPNSSPNEFIDRHAETDIATVRGMLEASVATAIEAIEAQRQVEPPLRCASIWGEQIDWRLFVAHFFYDGWIHERDLLLPLGRIPVTSDAEACLAATYGLHIAGIVAGMFAVPVDTVLRLGGTGGGTYRVSVDGFDVVISVAPIAPGDPPVNGDAIAVTDAISGRTPDLAAFLDADPAVVDALAGVGAFLRG